MRTESSITLLELQEKIRDSIESRLEKKYWVRGEISEISYQSNGHCYMDLIDRKADESQISARCQAIIWSTLFRMLRPFFESTTGQQLSKGMQVLVQAQVQYSPLYGLSLIISDIDPSYTVGEQELERQRTIARLREEGMFDMNSTLELTPLPRNLAVISSETAAGYRDFMNHLHKNDYGFKFITELFPAPVQGNSASAGIIEAMDKVAARAGEFDMLLIIRGGGSVQDLICFDDYELAANIAQFPIPVLTGIGHDHDFHVADMVAHKSVKTPTAAADFLIDIFAAEEQQVAYLSGRLFSAIETRVIIETNRLENYRRNLMEGYRSNINNSMHRLDMLQQRILSNNPLTLLKKGYSITLCNGKRVYSVKDVKSGDNVKVLMDKGILNCNIESVDYEKE
ncbi:MAG: exodeoxyribonuclease VII large subunit [Bacteroidales bacterium]|nr:exodeoxyribonuclease VII large subunit [Bacteroidales bacterium]MDD2280328.1 exodeoxyribonuclease VII large subunit [Bacteroidales bacterium]MDD4293015.1 exodeoxyribonuclease VII large subunit [Bacteroidales bacterium]MDD4491116.1 exodeoxyribonuclease VII large subunit [Bacteroidales bacterium]HNW48139.1 exodeoxyribonuclease VII large subunit [Bacteroidales bacterium]